MVTTAVDHFVFVKIHQIHHQFLAVVAAKTTRVPQSIAVLHSTGVDCHISNVYFFIALKIKNNIAIISSLIRVSAYYVQCQNS
jgi:hypothetical protein